MTRNPSGSQCNLQVKEARRIHESLKSVKADTFATLVSWLMQHGQRARLHDGTRMLEGTAIFAVADHNGLAVLVQRVINRSQASSFSPRFRSTNGEEGIGK